MILRKKLSGLARGITEKVAPNVNAALPANDGQTLTKRQPDVMVSVVIPVYNAMPYLTELLNSLEAQDLESDKFEVIAVNDGSTDFSGDILDVYAKRNANFSVVHQENSGWPGKPRNVGLLNSRGRYVFFVDGDDRLGPEALRRMVDFATEHDVDLLMPKMVGIGGRSIQASLFTRTRVDTDFEFILRSLSPQKMIRRELLIDHDIRFREEKVRLEDGMAMVQAYAVAKRISILADYDYYEIRTRPDGQNISVGKIEPYGYVESLSEIAATARKYAGPDEKYSRQLCAGLFIRKGLRMYEGKRFLRYTPAEQQDWVTAHQRFLDEFIAIERDQLFNPERMNVVNMIVNGDVQGLRARAENQASSARPPQVNHIEARNEDVALRIAVVETPMDPVRIRIVDRDTGEQLQVDGVFQKAEGTFDVLVPGTRIIDGINRLGDAFVVYADGSTKRIAVPSDFEEKEIQGIRSYRTANGFLSVDTRKARK